MDNSLSILPPNRKWLLFQAASDFFFLLNKAYPRTTALDLTGNRYGLNALERMLLSRGLFSRQEALARRGKREMGQGWQGRLLVVDGHNVQITIESYIEGRPLLKANDGALRDLAAQSYRFRLTESSNVALDMLIRFFERFVPHEVLFLFDQPMSRSGELAAVYRDRLARAGISGTARATPVPEREFPYGRCVAASSDRAVLDSSTRWMDLACRVIEYHATPQITADFSGIIEADSIAKSLFEDGGPFW
jgi:hypothetical protein